jgi:hypothetical protein
MLNVELKGRLNESQGEISGASSLRSNGSHDSQEERLDCVSNGQRQTKGGYWDLVPSDQMVLG